MDNYDDFEFAAEALLQVNVKILDHEIRHLQCLMCGADWEAGYHPGWWICEYGQCNEPEDWEQYEIQRKADEEDIKIVGNSGEWLECKVCRGQFKMSNQVYWWECPYSHDKYT